MAKDMTKGKPFPTMVSFAIPIVLGNLFQQMYNIVDTIVVGNYVGEDALAAVGICGSLAFLFVALAVGMGIGCSIIISQLFGATKLKRMKEAIYTALISMFILSLILMAAGLLLNKSLLQLMQTPDNIINDAVTYMAIYCLGIPFLFMYNILNSTFNALGDSKFPLGFLMLSSIINIVLDLHFVINYGMGVAGVAWATLIAQAIASILSFIVLMHHLKKIKVNEKVSLFEKDILSKMLKVAIPSTVQQSIVSLGTICVQGLINSFGSTVTASFTVANKIDQIAVVPMVQVSTATSTFTAQNIGAGKKDRVRSGLLSAFGLTSIIYIIVALLIFFFGSYFIEAFVSEDVNHKVIELALYGIQFTSLFYIVFGLMNNTNGVLRGAGDMKWFMCVTLSNFTVRIVGAYFLSSYYGPQGIWYAVPIGWGFSLILAAARVISGKWKNKELLGAKEET